MPQPERWCPRCEDNRPLVEFSLTFNKRGTRYQAYCIPCNRAYQLEWYKNLAGKRLKSRRDRADARRQELRDKLYEYLLSHPCVDCGESDPIVLEFDHVGGNKMATISGMMKNRTAWPGILREIAKCVVRCANCHRRMTASRTGFWRHLKGSTCLKIDNVPITNGSEPSASVAASRAPSAAKSCNQKRKCGAGANTSVASGGR